MPHTGHSAAQPHRSYLLEPLLHVGFALTGVGTVLLGCILPWVSAQWHLRDKDAGLLLLVQFGGSASGALLVREKLWRTLALGYGLASAGAISIFLLPARWFPIYELAFAVFGLGLGLAMTSTNILAGRRFTERRGFALALLNFSWSAGAVACPLAAVEFLRHASSRSAYGLLGLLIIPFAMLPLLADPLKTDAQEPARAGSTHTKEAATIAYFAALAFLYVGTEATLGNWISTYATRATTWTFAGSGLVVAFFWAALLIGRAITPAILSVLPERRLYQISVAIVLGGVLLLLGAHQPATILAGSALSGLALAPLFPLIISLFFAEIGQSKNAGWVFAIAGFGGATLSWVTGLVSSDSGSLRLALLVPGSAALLLMLMFSYGRANRVQDSRRDARPEAILEPTIGGRPN